MEFQFLLGSKNLDRKKKICRKGKQTFYLIRIFKGFLMRIFLIFF